MKFLLTIWACILLTAVSARHIEKSKGEILPEHSGVGKFQDSIFANRPHNDEIIISHDVKPKKNDALSGIEIPTLKVDTSKGYTMPVKKLSGKGLAPMPGTDSLDRSSTISNSVYPKIIIRTAPADK